MRRYNHRMTIDMRTETWLKLGCELVEVLMLVQPVGIQIHWRGPRGCKLHLFAGRVASDRTWEDVFRLT
jgi:hypothetical protein